MTPTDSRGSSGVILVKIGNVWLSQSKKANLSFWIWYYQHQTDASIPLGKLVNWIAITKPVIWLVKIILKQEISLTMALYRKMVDGILFHLYHFSTKTADEMFRKTIETPFKTIRSSKTKLGVITISLNFIYKTSWDRENTLVPYVYSHAGTWCSYFLKNTFFRENPWKIKLITIYFWTVALQLLYPRTVSV